MKIKEITNPTLRWAVIKRLLDRVPDRPAGAGNFVSGGQFSEPSRRLMPGRHAAERSAKQVWNEVVEEMGSRSFFDDTLVKVHWIGLYTKRGRDLTSNTISYIQEHAGVEHSDEISATAYLREDLAKVSFPRPMIGVILRGRTTYAGAVDLGTQWSVKLKPEDIERQKGSGTRKLPWYEDEGTIADNMVVDEKSWRDHVWGPQYYRSNMPELVVGSWSFDTVLIPQSVMSAAPDDMQRVIEVANSLGSEVVDERGNRYETDAKMRVTETNLRKIIRATLLNEQDAQQVKYTGIVLSPATTANLRAQIYESGLADTIPGWETSNISTDHGNEQLNHHMTLTPGALSPDSPLRALLGERVPLLVTGWGFDPKLGVAAWRISIPPEMGITTKSGNPHITAALSDPAVKPFKAAQIKEWQPIPGGPFEIVGHVQEVRSVLSVKET